MSIEIQGVCDDRFLRMRDAFVANFDSGLEVGASLAMIYQGEPVVDLWAGYADVAQTTPWQQDTLTQVFSTTKVMIVVSILRLVDDGLIELDAPIAKYWPEFAQAGKSAITVRQALVHQAGIPGFTEVQPFEALQDWGHLTRTLAAQAPWFDPGTSCYHPVTYGFVLGELTRRVTGQMLSDFFAETFARPLGADFHVTLKDKVDFARVAEPVVVAPEGAHQFQPGSVGDRVISSVGAGDVHSWDYVSAENPSSNGLGNARSVARVGAVLAMGGELDGVRYLSREIVNEACTQQSRGEDLIIGPISFGLGLGLDSEDFPAPTRSSFHWGGHGGSWMVMDRDSGVSCAYAMNCLHLLPVDSALPMDPRQTRHWAALGSVMQALAAG